MGRGHHRRPRGFPCPQAQEPASAHLRVAAVLQLGAAEQDHLDQPCPSTPTRRAARVHRHGPRPCPAAHAVSPLDRRPHAPARTADRAARLTTRRDEQPDPRLTISAVDPTGRTVQLAWRPFPTPLDPASWAALTTCLEHRDQLGTLNPHLIVTGITRTRDTPADGTYLTRALTASGTTPSACRQTRIAQLVNDLDAKLTAAALGMHDSGLVRYLADNVDQDRLNPRSR